MADTEIEARVGYKHITNSGLGLATETDSVTDTCSTPLHPPEQTKRDVMFKVEVWVADHVYSEKMSIGCT